jgi:VIT1/CCC1 family predicted Fe2+/Mn2+ transporter
MASEAASSALKEEGVHSPGARSIREIVFGVNDGLVSVTVLVVAVAASGLSSKAVILAALAATTAATVSMALGAYLSTQAQNEYFQSEWEREMREVDEVPDEERREVEGILRQKGFPHDEAEQFTRRLMQDKHQWVDFMMKEELGIIVEGLDSPWTSAGIMALAVIAGSLAPVLPFLFIHIPPLAMRWAIGFALLAAFVLGAVKANVAKGVWWKSGLQFVLVAVIGIVLGILAGQLFGHIIG